MYGGFRAAYLIHNMKMIKVYVQLQKIYSEEYTS